MTASAIPERLAALRRRMAEDDIDAFYLPNADPHMSEYLPDHWKQVEWLTGFTGENATLVVTRRQAALWTDSRFFLSGAAQLQGTGVQLMKAGLPGTPSVHQWLDSEAAPRMVGTDYRLVTERELATLGREMPTDSLFADGEGPYDRDFRPLDDLWTDRPPMPAAPIECYPPAQSGEKTGRRIARILAEVQRQGANSLLLTALDDIAWALNLRGSDIHCTPVFTAYALLSTEGSLLFVRPQQVSADVRHSLRLDGVHVVDYAHLAKTLRRLHRGYRIMARPDACSVEVARAVRLAAHGNPVPLMKAVKNKTEIQGTRAAMLKDGIALTRFFRWLEERLEGEAEFAMGTEGNLAIAGEVTETDCARRLIELRRGQPGYREESFDAIVAWHGHAALPHYFPTPESDIPITGNGLLLIDTGAQYDDGTTDITRTVGIGALTPDERRDYTLVLKGHIRLATAAFPEGTRGDQLDALARIDLWRDAKTYRHGTGHGVGHCLGVHEGPQSIRMEHNPQPLLPGMILSNEPAVYLGGRYGIRHENLLLVRPLYPTHDCPDATPCDPDEMGRFLTFETLTLCYIDTRPVLRELLTPDEQAWLNAYNRRVCDTLSPHLDEAERAWLGQKTLPL